MARRRMFSQDIIDTDFFLDMPSSAQNLYFHFGMRGDDDGFVSSPKKIIKMVNASDDDFKLLIAKGFIIPFDSGVCVITHWRIHNYIQTDRYKSSLYKEEKALLNEDENKMYTKCIQDVSSTVDTQVSQGKISIDKINNIDTATQIDKNIKHNSFIKPTIEEVKEYFTEKGCSGHTEPYYDFYQSKGWMVGRNKMKDWKAACRNWIRQSKEFSKVEIIDKEKPLPYGHPDRKPREFF